MIINTLKTIFRRDLGRLKKELELYTDESKMWLIEDSISNSAGNLALHLIGNLNTYIGFGLAEVPFERNRDFEFSAKNVPRDTMLQQINDTIEVIDKGLNTLTEDQMSDYFPIAIWSKPTEMEFTLVHFTTHLTYHLGQINYHRRLLDK